MSNVFRAATVALLFIAPQVVHAQWFRLEYPQGGIAVDFPAAPKHDYSARTGHRWHLRHQDNQVTYVLVYAPFGKNMGAVPKSIRRLLREKFLPSLVENDEIISTEYSTLSGNDVLNFVSRSSTDPNGLLTRGRVFVTEKALYYQAVMYYHADLVDYDRFAASFHIK